MKPFRSLLILFLCYMVSSGQNSFASEVPSNKNGDSFLLTIFLKHDQSKTLAEIQEELNSTGFWEKFPPEGIEVVSWYVMMGIGQVVTISVPPERLREVNRVIEQTAWGAFRTEFYPSYDLSGVAKDLRKKAIDSKKK